MARCAAKSYRSKGRYFYLWGRTGLLKKVSGRHCPSTACSKKPPCASSEASTVNAIVNTVDGVEQERCVC